MTDNAKNDKYTIPLLKHVKYRLNDDNHVPRVQLLNDSGSPVIFENTVTLYDDRQESVIGDQCKPFQIRREGLIFECYLPAVSAPYTGTDIYVGLSSHYGYLSANNQIYFETNDDTSSTYTYCPGDLFRMYFDGRNVRFSLNGHVKATLQISCGYSTDYLYIGFDSHGNNEHNFEFTGIQLYQTGKKARNGDDGCNGNSLLSGSGDPFPTLGRDNDSYVDILTNNLWSKQSCSWNPVSVPNPAGFLTTLASNSSVNIWDFTNTTYSSVLINIIIAASATDRTPVSVVQVAVNKSGTTAVPLWSLAGTLPGTLYILTLNSQSPDPVFNGVQLCSLSGDPAYNYITVRVQIIN